jgi:hypothetical protein
MVLFPVLWSLLQTFTGTAITQWNPLTLQGAGLFHIAMGAVLGIAAFGRTQEKLGGANNGGAIPPAMAPAPVAPAPAFGPAVSTAPSFGSPAPSFGGFGSTSPVSTNASGKKVVPDEQQPLL